MYERHAKTKPAGTLIADTDDFGPISIAASPTMKASSATGTDGARATRATLAITAGHAVIGRCSFRLIREQAATASTIRASAWRSVNEKGAS